ncbi:MAG TPA: Gfo/Idh/MocA family oxidoreductase [Christensenellaceae bacterium]|nr:Gfo/Idh/MocA family oxidoreductase [Christensenellaceae bacterium]
MRQVNMAISSLTHAHVRKYYATLHENPKLNWVAVSCANEYVANDFKKYGYDIPIYMSTEKMLQEHPEIEGVVIASENDCHYLEMELCCKYGKDILSMKIPTFDLEEYDRMIKMTDDNDIICQVELEMHYNATCRKAIELARSGEIGDIVSFNATNITLSPVWAFPWQGVPEKSYGKRVPIRDNDKRFRGGALSDHPHIFDMLRWCTDSEFDYVFADVADNIRDIKVEDVLYITGQMKNGCKFLLDPSWSRHEEKLERPGPGWEVFPKRMEVNFSIVGTKGVIQADCFGPNVYFNGGPNNRYTVQYTYFDEWIGMMDEFYNCILNRQQPKINLKWHRKTIEAMVRCYDSIAYEKPIYIK